MAFISSRARDNLRPNKALELILHAFADQYDQVTNPDGIVALAVAENKLMHAEVAEHINKHFRMTPWMLTYGDGFTGSRALKRALAKYINIHFTPRQKIDESAICVTNGVGSAVDNLGFCIGEPGDGILIGKPLYAGFVPDLAAYSKLTPVMVSMGDINPTSADAVSQYETAFLEAEREGTRIRAILLASPHNPLGRPYDVAALEGYLRLCSKYNIHLISDEVYAQAVFPSYDIPNPPPFVSVLSLDLEKFISPSFVHVLYGMSKDWCANGIRAGAIISPFNAELRKVLFTIASFTRASSMAEQAWLDILEDEEWLASYFSTSTAKMTAAYDYCASTLKQHGIPYSPASAGPFIWLDLSKYLKEDSAEGELELGWKMVHSGVWLGLGESFCSEKHGNFRLTFATPEAEFKLGMDRLVMPITTGVYGLTKEDTLLSDKACGCVEAIR